MMQIAKQLTKYGKASICALVVLCALVATGLSVVTVSAAPDPPASSNYCPAGSGPNTNYNPNDNNKNNDNPCIANDKITNNRDPAAKGCATGGESCGIIQKWVNPFINFLAGVTGLVVTISIVAGGIQYASSAGDPSKVAAAKSRIFNSVIALLVFLFLYVILQWIVPGGIV